MCAFEAKKLMGVWVAPSGKNSAQVTEMISTAQDWLAPLQQNHLSRRLARQAFDGVLWSSLQYPLAVSSFSVPECSKIQDSLYYHLLPLIGVGHSISKVFRTAARGYHGLTLPDLHVENMVAKLEDLLAHSNSASLFGHLL